MKALLVLTMLAAIVRLDLELDNEVIKISSRLFFVRHFISGVFVRSTLSSKCLAIDVTPPSAFKFNGSNYLFKLLRLAYFNDLTKELTEASAPNTVFKVALASAESYQCKIDKQEIYRQVIKKFPKPCVVPGSNEVHFRDSDLKEISGYSSTCPEKLNSIVNSIIDGFNDITSEDQKFFDKYFDGLNLLYIAYANEYKKEHSNENNLKLRFLLLNEFLLSGLNKFTNRCFDANIDKVGDDLIKSLEIVGDKMGHLTDISSTERKDYLNKLMSLKSVVLSNLIGSESEDQKQKEIQELLKDISESDKKRVI